MGEVALYWKLVTLPRISESDAPRSLLSARQLIQSHPDDMINTRAHYKLLHAWIILVILEQHLVHVGRIDGPTEYLSYIFRRDSIPLSSLQGFRRGTWHWSPAETPN
jgi:hypothetical protein